MDEKSLSKLADDGVIQCIVQDIRLYEKLYETEENPDSYSG